ncbi:platelet basic protein [Dasypus novemcinctus]|uniref:platelet basic protein n=1 Tax=Dasypus novemcinctus TaxID=9361 RepID=UPI00265F8FA6|nr:platelet basic protein [Dasypus novemcinctus]
MILRCNVASSCTSPLRVLRVLLLLSLLWTVLVPSTWGETKSEPFLELRCRCLKITPRIHPSHIHNLEVISAGAHCAMVEVIATLKDGRKVCLDPEARGIKKVVQKILEGDGSAA